MLVLAATAAALGQDAHSRAELPRPIAGHPAFELRGGVVTSPEGGPVAAPPTVCAEGYPLGWMSFEACGNGSGIWHDGPDLAHFRARAQIGSVERGRAEAGVWLGAGWAEVQSERDSPGFKFGAPTEADPVEAAGAEGSVSLKGRWWVDPAARTYGTADINAGIAAIPGAPAVIPDASQLVPFAQLTLGLGF
jgi:hypothetical protein